MQMKDLAVAMAEEVGRHQFAVGRSMDIGAATLSQARNNVAALGDGVEMVQAILDTPANHPFPSLMAFHRLALDDMHGATLAAQEALAHYEAFLPRH